MARSVTEILSHLPENFNEVAVGEKYPHRFEDCRNTLLLHEICQYNRLLFCIRTTSEQVLQAIKGIYLVDIRFSVSEQVR